MRSLFEGVGGAIILIMKILEGRSLFGCGGDRFLGINSHKAYYS